MTINLLIGGGKKAKVQTNSQAMSPTIHALAKLALGQNSS